MESKRQGDASGASTPDVSVQDALLQYTQHVPKPFAVTRGPDHRLAYANAAFCSLTSAGEDFVLGLPIADAFPGAAGRELSKVLDQSLRDTIDLTDVPVGAFEEGGTEFQVCAWPVIGEDGGADALGLELREIIEPDSAREFQRQLAEQMLLGALRERGLADDAEDARRRAAFLAEASRLLAESLGQVNTLLALTKLALPMLGSWCIVDVFGDDGAVRRLDIYHSDPEKQRVARELVATWAPDGDDGFGAPAMLREARAHRLTEGVEDALAASARSAENLERLRQLGIGPMLTVPMIAREEMVGAITFVAATPGLVYSPEDVRLAEDLAARGAHALADAQSYELAITLQHRAEAANSAKTAFLGAMSHELRTPLNAIGGYVDLLEMGLRGPLTDLQRSDLARVRNNQEHLATMVTEILDFAKAGSGHVTCSAEDVQCCAAIQRAVDLIEPLFATKGLTFDGISGDPTLIAYADPDRVAQILVNMLSNAIKFTPAGGRVSAGCAASGDVTTFSVTDTGIGIAPEKIEVVFQPFVQLKDGFADRESGVGLGLAISRDLARAMSGDLTVKSRVGEGTTFTLSLPRAKT